MPALRPDQLNDLVTTTLPLLKRNSITSIALDLNEYISPKILNEKSVKERGGTDLQWRVKTKNTGNARNAGIFSEDVTGIEDQFVKASVPWYKQTGNWAYSVD